MILGGSLWTAVAYFLGRLGFGADLPLQKPLLDLDQIHIPLRVPGEHYVHPQSGLIFRPPGATDGSNFTCDYSAMEHLGWTACSSQNDRGCWLNNTITGQQWNITTNYEKSVIFSGGKVVPVTPTGITRNYTLYVGNQPINADGLDFALGKVFNKTYPGPWIQACWGDTIRVTVVNNLQNGNGTSIHWHGIRQFRTMHMDGVNGITQCPIPPNSPNNTFTYEFVATQYGSSWVHSHYSVQYADGLVAPITIHGPSSDHYDIAPDMPLLITDWAHNSAFEFILPGNDPLYPTILLNGIGNVTSFYPDLKPPIRTPYTLNFQENGTNPIRYLLRIINTSFQTQFVFSIDNHQLTVVEADFVPISPYTTSHVHIGIGQRYQLIVEASPTPYPNQKLPTDGNYWIRTHIMDDCTDAVVPVNNTWYMQTGILRYDNSSTTNPTTQPHPDLDTRCIEEPLGSLKPMVKWTVTKPSNNGSNGETENISFKDADISNFPLAGFALNPTTMQDWTPLQVDYRNPTFLNLNNSGPWNASTMVILEPDLTDKDWIVLQISSSVGTHPIHLHGHDFAILDKQDPKNPRNSFTLTEWDNPPRRDVILVPEGGSVTIAFHADNPGAWLVHCHIAAHAAMGLGLQILERQADAVEIWPSIDASPALQNAKKVCDNWNYWQSSCSNWWDKCDGELFQNDSGV